MIYIDMNMVRAGIVNHPADWKQSGYKEILSDKKIYSIIDPESLKELFDFHDIKTFQDYYKDLIN
jgi:putative transposase